MKIPRLILAAVGLTITVLPAQDNFAALRRAAEQGHAAAQVRLGAMYANGEGVLKDAAEAVRWYRLAAKQGHVPAQYNLGVMYTNGRGVGKDFVLAHMWFNIAGANGSEMAGEERDKLEREMTSDEIRRATELARECMASDYQDCTRRGVPGFGEDVFKTSEPGLTAPRLTYKVEPIYSKKALKARVEGVVGIEAVVHTNGSIESLRVVRSLGFGLDEKAIEALRQWKFRPGMLGGEPVAVKINIEANFSLR